MLTLIQITDVIFQKLNEIITILADLLQVCGCRLPKIPLYRNHSSFRLLVRQRVIHLPQISFSPRICVLRS